MQPNQTQASNAASPKLWVRNHSAYLFSYAYCRLKDRDQARDLVQDTFLSALHAVEKFEGRCSERTWLTSILKNKIMDVFRKRKQRNLISFESVDVLNELIDFENGRWRNYQAQKQAITDEPNPLMVKDLERIIGLWMKRLPTLWSSAFERKYINNEQTKSICSELNITPSNFWVIMHRTRTDLKACLEKNW